MRYGTAWPGYSRRSRAAGSTRWSARRAEIASAGRGSPSAGAPEPPPIVGANAYRIGCRALTNAFRNAEASKIDIGSRTAAAACVADRDDGRDLPSSRASAPAACSRWDAAPRLIGGRPTVSAPGTGGSGTLIELDLPGLVHGASAIRVFPTPESPARSSALPARCSVRPLELRTEQPDRVHAVDRAASALDHAGAAPALRRARARLPDDGLPRVRQPRASAPASPHRPGSRGAQRRRSARRRRSKVREGEGLEPDEVDPLVLAHECPGTRPASLTTRRTSTGFV